MCEFGFKIMYIVVNFMNLSSLLILIYYGIHHISLVYNSVMKAIHVVLECNLILCIYVLYFGFQKF